MLYRVDILFYLSPLHRIVLVGCAFYLVPVLLTCLHVRMIITICFDHCSHSFYGCLVFDQIAFIYSIHIILDRIILATYSYL